MNPSERIKPISSTRSAKRHVRDWEELGRIDPYWSVLTDPARRRTGWDVADFLATGEVEVEQVLAAASKHGLPARWQSALDVGCGVGRVTLALSARFAECRGADVSIAMLEHARRLARQRTNVTFVTLDANQPLPFDSGAFDLVYCSRVLQHLPDRAAIKGLISELVRVLAPGGLLVMQLPSHVPQRRQFQLRRRIYSLLRGLRLPPGVLLRGRLLNPMRMLAMPPDDVLATLRIAGGTLVTQLISELGDSGIRQALYFVTRRAGNAGMPA